MALRKRCLGIDLGSSTIKVAELVAEREGVRIERLVSAPTPILATSTPAERQSALAKVLRDLLRSNRISTREAVFALPGQTAFVRRFRLPATTQERLERIIRYEARQQIPFPLERTQLEYQIIPSPETNEVEVLLVAIRQDQIQDFISLVNRTGLAAVSIAVNPFALYNFHAAQSQSFDKLTGTTKSQSKKGKGLKLDFLKKKGAKKAETSEAVDEQKPQDEQAEFEEVKAFLHVGAGAMDLAIARLGKQVLLGFTRSVPTAGNEITRSIQEKCRLESFDDAERVKLSNVRATTFDFDPDAAGEEINVTACQAATSMIDRIISDLRRSLDFYISQPDGMAVDSLLVSGGQSLMPGFAEYIEEKLGLSVGRVSSPTCDWLKFSQALASSEPKPDLAAYSVAVGLALQGIGLGRLNVDFLPREKKVLRDFPYRRAGVMAGILAGILIFASQSGKKYAEIYSAQRVAIENDLVQRKLRDDASTQAQKTRKDVKDYFDDLAPAFGQRDFWMRFLAGIQEVKPAEVLLDTLVLDKDGKVMIIGVSKSQNAAAEFTVRLKGVSEKQAEEPQLTQMDNTDYPGIPEGKVWKFTVTLKVSEVKNRMLLKDAPAPQTPAAGQSGVPPYAAGPYGPRSPYGPGMQGGMK